MTPERACKSKRFYDSEWEAINQAAIQRGHSGHPNIEAYKCPYCPGFHIGHQGGWPKETWKIRVDCEWCKATSMTPRNADRHYRRMHKGKHFILDKRAK